MISTSKCINFEPKSLNLQKGYISKNNRHWGDLKHIIPKDVFPEFLVFIDFGTKEKGIFTFRIILSIGFSIQDLFLMSFFKK